MRTAQSTSAAAAAAAADAVPASDDAKRAAYAAVASDLAAFFESEALAEAKRGGGSAGAPWAGVDTVGRMSLLCAFLARAFPSWHFVGFYVVVKKAAAAGGGGDSDGGEELQIGPYQGDVLATARIPFGRGQCGACAEARATQIAADVSVRARARARLAHARRGAAAAAHFIRLCALSAPRRYAPTTFRATT